MRQILVVTSKLTIIPQYGSNQAQNCNLSFGSRSADLIFSRGPNFPPWFPPTSPSPTEALMKIRIHLANSKNTECNSDPDKACY